MSKARIIIVEDENILAKDLATSLGDMGYEVTSVTGRGEEAVRRSGEERPDCTDGCGAERQNGRN